MAGIGGGPGKMLAATLQHGVWCRTGHDGFNIENADASSAEGIKNFSASAVGDSPLVSEKPVKWSEKSQQNTVVFAAETKNIMLPCYTRATADDKF